MAIQVSGTTVIDDSRNLVNVIGLKTVNSTSLLGSGDIAAGASTTFGDVGTYIWGRPASTTLYAVDATASSLYAVRLVTTAGAQWSTLYGWEAGVPSSVLSGTWRTMQGAGQTSGSNGLMGLWVRIS
jgi:hypothetical protein